MSPSEAVPPVERARLLLRRHWGHDDFRTFQRPVIRAMLAGRDVLAMLPTGGGKSVCFQVPARTGGGLTVVVSPLISLMIDQVAAVRGRGLEAAALTSMTPPAERRRTLAAIRARGLELLYLSPERLSSGSLAALLRGAGLARVAVDEAHCISEWGHDFRPAYRRIGEGLDRMGRPPVAAFTATATPRTRTDISESLGLRRPTKVVAPVDRPSLRWAVSRARSRQEAARTVLAALRRTPGAALVYVPTRRQAGATAEACRRRGISVMPYHAGLTARVRSAVQESFLAGRTRVVCATSAFGMGIDHERVRLVAHVGAPGSLEAYVQEAGRAGRDGRPALCLLASYRGDLRLQRSFARRSWPRPSLVRAVWRTMRPGEPTTLEELVGRLEQNFWRRAPEPGAVSSALRILVRYGAARELSTAAGTSWRRGPDVLLRRVDLGSIRRGRRRARRRRRSVRRYLRTRGCRRAVVARWFGQAPPACRGCDRCGGARSG